MKKVININFQGRVIPIEETAYDMLKRYVDSLRVFFANEEGRDEIINDIEGRIAELFGETLKKGSTCIVEQDVETIIASMGRPEDFDAEEDNVKSQLGGEQTSTNTNQERGWTYGNTTTSKRLYRDENHKVLGGVCGGIANYLNMDPTIVRILFAVFSIAFGFGFFVYLILWIFVPGSSSVVIGSQRKRLFRDPDSRMIAGVCSGLAQYFSVQVWIPRLLFLIPFLSFVFRWGNWGWWDFPHFLSFSFSPGSVFIYIVFWLVLPEAKSAADKLEMKGEKVDLNNIKSTIQSDLEGFKERAQSFGNELKERAQEFGNNFSNYSQNFSGAATGTTAGAATTMAAEPVTTRKRRGGVVRVFVILIKVFVYFILGCILFSIAAGLFAAGAALTGLLPTYSSYILNDGFQKLLAWGTLICFVWVPVIAIVTWIIRRISGKRGNRGIIRLTFLSLWIFGFICFINLVVQIRNEFRYRNYPTEQAVQLANPGAQKLVVKYAPFGRYYNNSWLKMDPFASFDDDTVFVRNIRLRLVKGNSDSFQVTMVKMANGNSKTKAENLATKMSYSVRQTDSVLLLDKGIAITKEDKFRNQQVIITVAVPVGKRIMVAENVGWGNDVHVDFGRDDDYWDWENNMETEALKWRHNVEYVMTNDGLERVNKTRDEDDNEDGGNEAIDQYRKSKEQIQREKEQKLRELQEIDRELQRSDDSTRYHYRPTPDTPARKTRVVEKNTAVAAMPNVRDMMMIRFAM